MIELREKRPNAGEFRAAAGNMAGDDRFSGGTGNEGEEIEWRKSP